MPLSYSTLEWGGGGAQVLFALQVLLNYDLSPWTCHRHWVCFFFPLTTNIYVEVKTSPCNAQRHRGHKVRHARWHLHAMCNDSAGRYILFAPTRVDASSSKSSNKPAQPMLDDTCASVHISMWIVFFHGEISHNASCTPQHEPTPNDGLLWTSPCR